MPITSSLISAGDSCEASVLSGQWSISAGSNEKDNLPVPFHSKSLLTAVSVEADDIFAQKSIYSTAPSPGCPSGLAQVPGR